MKKLIQYSLLPVILAVSFSLKAQTKQQPYDMMVNGVKVIVKPAGNDIVVIQTIVKGGVQNLTEDNAGIESLATRGLTECGAGADDKNTYKDKLDKVSAYVNGNAGEDYSTVSMNCIKMDFENVWPLYTIAMLQPKFDNKEFERIKQDQVNGIRATESSPDAALRKMSKENAFAGQKFALSPQGTVKSVSTLTAEQTKNYWHSIFTRSRMVIVVVADLDKSNIEKKVKDFLSMVPAGAPFKMKKQSYNPAANTFKSQQRENATNYIGGITGGPQPGTPDYNAFILAMRVFATKHFIEIRTKNGLSYAPQSYFNSGANNYSVLSVTTTDPDKYVAVARQLIDKIKKDGFTQQDLKNEKTGYLTGLYYRDETNDALASSLANNEVIHGNWKRTVNIKNDMAKVNVNQLNSVFKKYINNITWSYQGDPGKVNPLLYTQKETPKLPLEKKAF